ncbi:MAG: AAA family ATPase [Planctomycetota bacterium]
MSVPSTTFLQRVRLKNYRSIGSCDVVLGPLTFLVGPNGSGKSNFLDALRFVADALNQTLDHAIRDRGGIDAVRRRSSGHPRHFGIRLDLRGERCSGHYAFEIGAGPDGAWSVKREECFVQKAGVEFEVRDGAVERFSPQLGTAPAATADRLFLANASGFAPFRPVYDALTRMGFYNLSPTVMRELQPPDPAYVLARDGANAASALARLDAVPVAKQRLVDYLGKVVPGIVDVARKAIGRSETIEFRQHVQGAKDAWHFTSQDMSDGTIRALGVLLALHQIGNGMPIPLVGIEEPETALHPAAAGVLLDALRDAASRMQVIATSHSAELLDDKDMPDDSILAVVAEQNETRIGPLAQAGREALRERLYTAGELLRMNQLHPDETASRPRQLDLFGRSET